MKLYHYSGISHVRISANLPLVIKQSCRSLCAWEKRAVGCMSGFERLLCVREVCDKADTLVATAETEPFPSSCLVYDDDPKALPCGQRQRKGGLPAWNLCMKWGITHNYQQESGNPHSYYKLHKALGGPGHLEVAAVRSSVSPGSSST